MCSHDEPTVGDFPWTDLDNEVFYLLNHNFINCSIYNLYTMMILLILITISKATRRPYFSEAP